MARAYRRPGSGLVRTVLGVLTLCLGFAIGGQALGTPTAALTNGSIELHIPAGDLGTALKELAVAAHRQLLFSDAIVTGHHSAALTGHYTLDDALQILLAGTGLKVDRTRSGVILIRRSVFLQDSSSATLEAPRIAAANSEAAAAAAPAEPTAEAGGGLQEVVVTATRREEAIQRVPVSVQAITGAQIEAAGIREMPDVARLTPSLQINVSVSPYSGTSNNVAIRGIASNAGQPTTGIYIDDTPIQPLSGSNTVFPLVFDLNRVEVLRGPQGTLFGSGSEGGAIRFIQEQPSLTQYTGYARAEGANTEGHAASYELGAAYGGPIIDDVLGFRVNAYYRQDGGWIDYGPVSSFTVNHANGMGLGAAATMIPDESAVTKNINWEDSRVFHAALRWQPISNLTITPSLFYQRQDFGYPSNTFWLAGSNPGANSYFIPQFTPGPVGSTVCSGPKCPDPGPLSQLTLPTGLFANTTLNVQALNIQWNIGDFATLTSTTSYVHKGEVDNYDTTIYYEVVAIDKALQPFPLPGQFSPTWSEESANTFSQEFRLNGTSKYLNWQVGGYLQNINQHNFEYEENNTWTGSTYFYGQYVPPGGPPFGPGYSSFDDYWGAPMLSGSGTYYGDSKRHDKQVAGFAQLDFKFNSIFSLTAGIRFTSDTQTYSLVAPGVENNLNIPAGGACPTGPVCPYGSGFYAPSYSQGQVGASAHPTTPKFALNAQLTPNNLVYASATKGFRIGGVQLPKPADCASDLIALGYVDANGKAYTPVSYNPDFVWSYELGTKNTTDNGKLLINASVYEIKWKDIQTSVSLSTCGYGLIVNTGSATVKGFDFESQYAPIHGLNLRADIGYTKTSLDDGLYQPNGSAVYARGSAIPNSGAPWNLVFSGRYEFPVTGQVNGYVYGDDSWSSQWPRTGRDDPQVYNYLPYWPPYPSVNTATLRVGGIHQGLDVSLFINNLLNAHPLFVGPDNQLRYIWNATTIRPRTYGITAAYRF